jgi:8-hydroxy-5-deazaflavin:NADPH oxidoreductase
MKISIIGGTGGMGEGFALRWVVNHDITIGSRDAEKAATSAEQYMNTAVSSYGNSMKGTIKGADYISSARDSDILILSIPYESIKLTCDSISNNITNNCIIVSPIVPMERNDTGGFTYIPFEKRMKSAAHILVENLPGKKIVSAFHTISEVKLKNINESLDSDTFVCGDDQDAITKLNQLIGEIKGLRPLYLGSLSISYQAEVLTPMLLNASKKNKIKHPGIKLI